VMFIITTVQVQFPANNFGPPNPENPIADLTRRVLRGQVALSGDQFNLGLLVGIPSVWSILPPLLLLSLLVFAAFRMTRTDSIAAVPEPI